MPEIKRPRQSGNGRQPAAARPSPELARQAIALVGLSCVAAGEAAPGGFAPRGVLAELGVSALLIAALFALVAPHRNGADVGDGPDRPDVQYSVRAWRWTLIGLGCFGLLVAQTWFRAGTAIAGGDISPPLGTAWLAHIFSPFAWSIDNLGGPGQAQGQLPWAAVDWVVHIAGGSGVLAQRIWLSLLVGAAFVGAAALVRALGFGPMAGIAASLLYFLTQRISLTDP